MVFPIKRLLRPHRIEPEGIKDECANCLYPYKMVLMFYMLEAHIAAT